MQLNKMGTAISSFSSFIPTKVEIYPLTLFLIRKKMM